MKEGFSTFGTQCGILGVMQTHCANYVHNELSSHKEILKETVQNVVTNAVQSPYFSENVICIPRLTTESSARPHKGWEEERASKPS